MTAAATVAAATAAAVATCLEADEGVGRCGGDDEDMIHAWSGKSDLSSLSFPEMMQHRLPAAERIKNELRVCSHQPEWTDAHDASNLMGTKLEAKRTTDRSPL